MAHSARSTSGNMLIYILGAIFLMGLLIVLINLRNVLCAHTLWSFTGKNKKDRKDAEGEKGTIHFF